MQVESTPIEDALLIRPRVFPDDRGCLFESFSRDRYAEAGLPPFVQDNISESRRGVLRGLHYQTQRPQGKLVCCLVGSVLDAIVDLRRASPSFGKWFAVELRAEDHVQFWVPAGCAHGFLVKSDFALVEYKCTDFYLPECQRTIAWNDADLGITWPTDTPLLSAKDQRGARFVDADHFS